MKSVPRSFLATIAIVGLFGCASVPLPPEAAAVTLVPVPSKSVAVYQPKFIVVEGRLNLDGYVYRQFNAETTARSHIEIVFFDVTGRELHREMTDFSPRDLRHGGHRMQPSGHYSVPISVMPLGTVKIQVSAHDREHSP